VSPGHTAGFSRMTIACQGDPTAVDQIVKQLDKLVDTVHASEHAQEDAVERELGMIKVRAKPEERTALLQIVEVFRGKTVDIADKSLTIEVTGDSAKLDALEKLLSSFGIIEMVRSGKVVIARGSERT